ncbi:MAG TPA: Ppx/GppA family phosphatase, partial [Thermoanaerobaculia bacterium]
MAKKPHRLAAIDVGTNSIHMIIVECRGRSCRIIDKEKEMVQLGAGSLDGGPLTAEAMQRGVEALRTMAEIARRWSVDRLEAVA